MIGHSVADQLIQIRIVFRCRIRCILAEITPNLFAIRIAHHTDKVQQQPECNRNRVFWNITIVNMMHRVAELLVRCLIVPVGAELEIFIYGFRDHAEMQLLCGLRLAIDIECKAVLRAITQPFV